MTMSQDYYFTNKATAFFSINNHVIFIFCQSRMNSINIRLLIKNNNELKINWGAWFASSHSNGCTKAVRYTGISSYCGILLILFLLYYLQVHGLNTEFTVAPIYGIFNITEINDSERYISMCSGVLFCS